MDKCFHLHSIPTLFSLCERQVRWIHVSMGLEKNKWVLFFGLFMLKLQVRRLPLCIPLKRKERGEKLKFFSIRNGESWRVVGKGKVHFQGKDKKKKKRDKKGALGISWLIGFYEWKRQISVYLAVTCCINSLCCLSLSCSSCPITVQIKHKPQ